MSTLGGILAAEPLLSTWDSTLRGPPLPQDSQGLPGRPSKGAGEGRLRPQTQSALLESFHILSRFFNLQRLCGPRARTSILSAPVGIRGPLPGKKTWTLQGVLLLTRDPT